MSNLRKLAIKHLCMSFCCIYQLCFYTIFITDPEPAQQNVIDAALKSALFSGCSALQSGTSSGDYFAAQTQLKFKSHRALEGMVESQPAVTVAFLANAADQFGSRMKVLRAERPTLAYRVGDSITTLVDHFREFADTDCHSVYFNTSISILLQYSPESAISTIIRQSSKIDERNILGWLAGLRHCEPDLVERAARTLRWLDPGRFHGDILLQVEKLAMPSVKLSYPALTCPLFKYSPADLAVFPTAVFEQSPLNYINLLSYAYWLMPDSFLIDVELTEPVFILVALCHDLESELKQLMADRASTSRDFATRNAARILGVACAPEAHAWLARAVRKGWTRPNESVPKVRDHQSTPPKRDPVVWMGRVALRDGLAFANSPLLKGVLLDTPDPRDADLIATVTWEPGPERERIRKKLLAWQKKYPKDAAIQAALLSITPRLP